jgi:uncharacterized protein YjbI with pentapeptide repeats
VHGDRFQRDVVRSVIPAGQAGLRPARESRNPVNYPRRVTRRLSFTGSRLALARLSRARLAGTTVVVLHRISEVDLERVRSS